MVVVVSAKLEHVTRSLHNGGFAAVSLLNVNQQGVISGQKITCVANFYNININLYFLNFPREIVLGVTSEKYLYL